MSGAPSSDALVSRIRAYRNAADLSYSRLALKAGLSRAALIGMDKPDWSPTISTTRAIEGLIPEGWNPGDPLPEQGQVA